MTKLTDTQSILLSTASQRENGSVLPLPTTPKPGGGISKAIAALLTRGLIEERETSDAAAVYRTDGDLRYALFLTPAGASAIGIEASGSVPTAENAAPASVLPVARRDTKADRVLGLLARTDGATLPELIEATGWLPHTTRAALTGLRKKGHSIQRGKRDGVTCYNVAREA